MKCRDCPVQLMVIEEAGGRCGVCKLGIKVKAGPVVSPVVSQEPDSVVSPVVSQGTKEQRWRRAHLDQRRAIHAAGQRRRRLLSTGSQDQGASDQEQGVGKSGG